jgi:hypothetical protein
LGNPKNLFVNIDVYWQIILKEIEKYGMGVCDLSQLDWIAVEFIYRFVTEMMNPRVSEKRPAKYFEASAVDSI